MRLRSPALLLTVPILLAAGCGSSGHSGSGKDSGSTTTSTPSATTTSAPSASSAGTSAIGPSVPSGGATATVPANAGTLADVKVGTGAAPLLTLLKKPVAVAKTATRVLTPGTGKPVTAGQSVQVNYVVVDGRDGKQDDTSFGKKPVGFYADPTRTLPGLAKSLVGAKIGERLLVAIPPADAFGSQGQSQLGIRPTDTIVFLLDIMAAHTPLTTATGTVVAPKAGLPTVRVDAKEHATITVPKTAAPKTLVAQPLIKGSGAKITAGQTLSVQYTGVLWRGGAEFDSTSKSNGGRSTSFTIGVGQVIPGWDKTLVGQTVGSRMLLVIPPADGYGPKGQPKSNPPILGTDTLVFVIDILDAT